MNKFFNMFHLLTFSPWPLIISFNLLIMMIGFLVFFMSQQIFLFFFGFFLLILGLFQWWRDVVRESVYLGCHSKKVFFGLKLGMLMFILSELMFFLSFFWMYFHSFLSPVVDVGLNWVPKMMYIFDPFGVPLLNTMILLLSGMLITWCHMKIISGKKMCASLLLFLTISLGFLFSTLQLNEYMSSMFMINDSVYGSIFFVLTGFHGIHVLIGTFYMIIMFIRLLKNEVSDNFHLGFEFCVWYWHFVDVVWLFLYFFLYFIMYL